VATQEEYHLAALNWHLGWSLIALGFASGAVLGLGFHRDDFLGGYPSFSRRLARLGHIACVALGMLNVLYGLHAAPGGTLWLARATSLAWAAGAVAMPTVCWLTAWRAGFRRWFFVPVAALLSAVLGTIVRGMP
jgi:hypothetical protein